MKESITKEEIGNLLVIYGKLLTEVVYRRMESFYLDDLSYSEIAKNEKVSKTAIYDSLHDGEKSLLEYEDKLKLYQRLKRLRYLFSKLEDKNITESQKTLLDEIKGEIEYGI